MKPVFTSASSPIEVDILTADLLQQPGQIAMTMAPGKQDEEKEMIWSRDLQADLERLREQFGINRLVCLLEEEELQHLGIPDLLTEAEARGVTTEHLPIPDEGLPDSMAAFAALVDRVVTALSGGETVLIHCKGGRGRTRHGGGSVSGEAGLLARGCDRNSPPDTLRCPVYRHEARLRRSVSRDPIYFSIRHLRNPHDSRFDDRR
jgi:protein-tyrosine phosphatase